MQLQIHCMQSCVCRMSTFSKSTATTHSLGVIYFRGASKLRHSLPTSALKLNTQNLTSPLNSVQSVSLRRNIIRVPSNWTNPDWYVSYQEGKSLKQFDLFAKLSAIKRNNFWLRTSCKVNSLLLTAHEEEPYTGEHYLPRVNHSLKLFCRV